MFILNNFKVDYIFLSIFFHIAQEIGSGYEIQTIPGTISFTKSFVMTNGLSITVKTVQDLVKKFLFVLVKDLLLKVSPIYLTY